MQISETDLILNPDGSVYHLNLRPEQIAETIIVVGDQDRVPMVSTKTLIPFEMILSSFAIKMRGFVIFNIGRRYILYQI